MFIVFFGFVVSYETVLIIVGVAIEDRDIAMAASVNAKVKCEIPDEGFEGKLNHFHIPYCYIMYMVLDYAAIVGMKWNKIKLVILLFGYFNDVMGKNGSILYFKLEGSKKRGLNGVDYIGSGL
jgi:hypothetical protein